MAVITKIDLHDVRNICKDLKLDIVNIEPIIQGTENSSFAILDSVGKKYIFTIFEQGDTRDIDFISELQVYLNANALPVLAPWQNSRGKNYSIYKNKPCLVFDFVRGYQIQEPSVYATKKVANYLANQHLLTENFSHYKPNLRYLDYLNDKSKLLKGFLSEEDSKLMVEEISIYTKKIGKSNLPKAVLHGDLFRDNVFFVEDESKNPKISAIIDFYNACTGARIYDLAVLVNDWCVNTASTLDIKAYKEVVAEYGKTLQLSVIEEELLPLMLRLVALRYWISRLSVVHLEPSCDRVAKDPNHFKNLLKNLKDNFARLS